MKFVDIVSLSGITRDQFSVLWYNGRLSCAWFIVLLTMSCTVVHAESQIFQVLIPAPANPEATRGLVYADAQNHIIMEYDLGRVENDKVYFTDGHPLFGLTDAQSYALANTPGLLEKFVAKHGLAQLEINFMGAALPGRYHIEEKTTYAPKCQWPYSVKLDIERKNRQLLGVMFFRRRATEDKALYQVWCEAGPGEIELTTRFENLPMTIFLDKNEKPLIGFQKPAIVLHFHDDGSRIDLHGAAGIFAVSATLAEHLFTMVAEGKILPQDAIKTLEAELDIADAQAK
jgi:hypothetical protein